MPETPWNYVIAISSFGTPDNEMSTWWNVMYVLPCSGSSTPASAQKVIGDLEGIMPGHLAGEGGSSSRDGPGRGAVRAVRDRSRTPPRKTGGRTNYEDVCSDWNWRLGRCGGRTHSCPFNLLHGICSVCLRGGHRACDAHGNQKGKGKGKGKEKGKGKDKGKKGKNKDDGSR